MKNKKFWCSILILFLFFVFSLPCVRADSGTTETMKIEVTPAITVPTIHGDKEKFEEDHWMSRNTSGGINNLSLEKKLDSGDTLSFDGKAIFGNNDYNTNLSLAREGVGSLNFGFKNFRKYFDGTGGYYPGYFYPQSELDNDLNLDIGSFKLEGILVKEDAPEYSLSYERAFRDGAKSLLRWGTVRQTAVSASSTQRKIYPAYLETNEKVDTVKLGVKHETSTSFASAEQLWESTRVENKNIASRTYTISTGASTSLTTQYLNLDSDRYATTLRYSKDLNNKLAATCGVLFNRYLGGSLESQDASTNRVNNPARIEQNGVTLSPNLSYTPFKDFLVNFASKAELENKKGTSTYNRVTTTSDILCESNIYSKIFTQNLELKYSGMKDVVWFTDGSFEKRYVHQTEEQVGSSVFSSDEDDITNKTDVTVGCKWYPLSNLSLTLQGKAKDQLTTYEYESLQGDVSDADPNYRAFFDSMSTYTRSPSAKIKYKPLRWLCTDLSYAYDSTIYGVRTRISDQILKSKYSADIYSGGLTLTPYEFLYCSLFYERKNATTKTAAESWPGTNVVLPLYNANFDVFRFNYGYALSKKLTLDGGYSMYSTDNFNDFTAPGLALGLDNIGRDAFIGLKHSLDKDRTCELKYSYSKYKENSNNNVDDYEAHLISAGFKHVF